MACQKIINFEATFCVECWKKISFITSPKCNICSNPFEFKTIEKNYIDDDQNLICSGCIAKKPFYDKSIILLSYNKIFKKIISDLKYNDQTFIAKKLAHFLKKNTAINSAKFDLATIVPLHKSRLRDRKFNQSALIAKNLIDKKDQSKLLLDLLIRVKKTSSQVGLSKRKRNENLKSAFILNSKYQKLVSNKSILLIDDVMTTSATINNCAKILKKNGAKEVIVFCIAKTIFNKSDF